MQDRLNLLLLVSGATALTLSLGLAPESQTLSAAISAVAFNAVYELLLSRQQQQYALVPFIDLANHAADVEAEVAYAYFKDGFTVDAGKQFRKGEQVVISYGRQTADSLLQYYGFLLPVGADGADTHTFVDLGDALVATGGVERSGVDVAGDGALARVVLTAAAQVDDETKAALRCATGVCASVAEGRGGGAAPRDARMWRAVAAVARAERDGLGDAVQVGSKARRGVEQLRSERDTLIAQYVDAKRAFLDARVAQLEKRAAQLERA